MDNAQILFDAFPALTSRQRGQFEALGTLYPEYNSRVNVISRKDIENLYTRHVLHSLAIAKLWGTLSTKTRVLDLGTGGGFPGIPLAIMYPDCEFHLVDRIGKKIAVAEGIAREIGLENVTFQHGDIGECHRRFDYVVSRAVTSLDALVKLAAKNIVAKRDAVKNVFAPGIFALKGGDISLESADVRFPVVEYSIHEFFNDDFFDTKMIVYVEVNKK